MAWIRIFCGTLLNFGGIFVAHYVSEIQYINVYFAIDGELWIWRS